MLLLLALTAAGQMQPPVPDEGEPMGDEGELLDPTSQLPTPDGPQLPKPPAGILPVAELPRLEYGPSDRPQVRFIGDTLVVVTASGTVEGHDGTTGEFRFKLGLPGESLFLPVAVGDDLVLASASGKLLRVDDERGTLLSEVSLPFPLALPPLASEETGSIYFGTPEGDVAAFDAGKLEGEPRFRVRTAERPSALAARGDVLIVSGAERTLTAIDARTGAPLWSFIGRGGFSPAAFREDGRRVFVGDDLGELYSLDVENGNVDFHWSTGASIRAAPLVEEKRVYVVSLGNYVYAYDARGGAEQWRAPLPGRPAAGATRMNTQLVVATLDGVVIEVDAGTGVLGKSYGLPSELGSPPAFHVVSAPEGYFEMLQERAEAARLAAAEEESRARAAASEAPDPDADADVEREEATDSQSESETSPAAGAEASTDPAAPGSPIPDDSLASTEAPDPAAAPGQAGSPLGSVDLPPAVEEPKEPEWFELSRIAAPLRSGEVVLLFHQPPAPAPAPPTDPTDPTDPTAPPTEGVPTEDTSVPNPPPPSPANPL